MTLRAIGFVTAVALGLVVTPLAADGQATKVYRVAVVFAASPVAEMAGPEPIHPGMRAFLRELRALGYVEGQNLVLERRSGEGKPERFPAIMAELVGLKVDVIVATTDAVAQAAKRATNTIPIVMGPVYDAVGAGLVTSLARPGGNVTGLTTVVDFNIHGKQLELLKEAVPGTTRVALIHQTPRLSPAFPKSYEAMLAAAQAVKVTLLPVVVDHPEQFADALTVIAHQRADALMDWGSGFNFAHRGRVVELATKRRLPAIFPFREFVEAGGLMSYGVSLPDLFHRAAGYVDRILKGARPGDLPVERPRKFDLVVNLKTAKALGLTLPPSVLLQASEIIE